MDLDIVSWLNLALRWFHVIAGIAWIGSSFYFIWLDNSLKPPSDEKDKKAGVGGELWAVHGGGFYHKKKYQVAPEHMPDDLHWFKWEAYFTWISGFALLTLMYYFGADLYLIDKSKFDFTPLQASLCGLGFLAGGWLFYDSLCRSPVGANTKLFSVIWFAFIVGSAWLLGQIFTGRGAFIHAGAMIGTAMAANVFMVIIPNQKKVVAAMLAGQPVDPKLGKTAKQRSMHNNYMTLPVLMLMISSHYPMLYSGPQAWLILAGLALSAMMIRHFFNLKHKGIENYAYPMGGIALFLLVMVFAAPDKAPSPGAGEQVSNAQIRAMIRTHCSACHSDTPVHASVSEAPMGVKFDTMDEIKLYAPRIRQQAVDAHTMPLGNETGMTDAERANLGAWIAALPTGEH